MLEPSPDYGRLGGDAGGPKRKRIASAVDEESTKVTKKKKEISEKTGCAMGTSIFGLGVVWRLIWPAPIVNRLRQFRPRQEQVRRYYTQSYREALYV